MRRTVAALAVLALGAAGCGPGSELSWRYDKVYKGLGGLSDLVAIAADDIWVAGAVISSDSGDKSADDGFLLHYDGTRWKRRPMPAALGESVYNARFDTLDAGGFLLTASLPNLNAPRMAHWDGTRWMALPDLPALSESPRAADVKAFAADDIWVLSGESRAYHWNGARWTAMILPATVTALDGAASDDLWAVGHRNTGFDAGGGQEEEYTQPAAVHWDGRTWKLVPTPEYHFPDPVPPEPGASLGDVLATARDDVRAYGEHTYNHGEVDNEPADEHIQLRWDGTRWIKRADTEGDCAGRVPVARDGERGMFLHGNRYLASDGACVRIKRPRLPSTGGIRSSSQQSLWLNAIEPVPGTDKVLGVGSVSVSQAGNPTSRSVIVSLRR